MLTSTRIGQLTAYDPRGSSVRMLFRLSHPKDVPHVVPVGFEVVCDQGPMAAPPNRLGTHDRQTALLCQCGQPADRHTKRLGLHVVRVAAEREIPPGSVV